MLENKKGVVIGVLNHRSIAYHAAIAAQNAGAQVVCTAFDTHLVKNCQALDIVDCDLSKTDDIIKLRDYVVQKFGTIDFIVHAAAYADLSQGHRLLDVSEEAFLQAMDVSCFSFTSVAQIFAEHTNAGGAYITTSYVGSHKVVDSYNIMGVAKAALESSVIYLAQSCGQHGIRVNCVSSSPLRTISAAAISNGRNIYNYSYDSAMIDQPVQQNDIANTIIFLASRYSSGITGEVIYVDNGFSSVSISQYDINSAAQ